MSDLISRNALINALEFHCEDTCKPNTIGGIVTGTVRDCIKIVSAQPTIEAVPVVHGEWKQCFEDWRMQIVGDECSACGFQHYGSSINHYNFCPNCGAKMKGEEHERSK
ncbi:MAG: hypothetical protein E7293_03310 [Lachnospiraceae bacterium]|nr:hypothetical protein [Lachnospiraceae bacterium]